jgi:hypothetical protein
MSETSLRLSKIPPGDLKRKAGKQTMESNGVVETKGGKVYTIDHDGRARGIEIVTPKRVYALPYNHFLRAEGDNSEIVALFSTDEVTIIGSHLEVLIKEFAQQRITALRQLTRAERMELSKEGPDIEEIRVTPARKRSTESESKNGRETRPREPSLT